MPAHQVEGQAYLNIFWYDPLAEEELPVELGQLYEKSRPVGMMAMNLIHMVMDKTELAPDDFDLILFHDAEHGAGFYIYPGNHLDDEAYSETEALMQEFFDYFAVYADAENLVHRDRTQCAFAFAGPRPFLRAMAAAVDDDPVFYTPDDMEAPGGGDPDYRAQIMEKGELALKDAWIYATMPERPCSSREELYELAFKTAIAPLPVPLTAIADAIEAGEKRHDRSTPQDRQMLAYNPHGMNLH